METTVTLTVNRTPRTLTTNAERPLLDILREELGLTGTKYGCGEGRCGACTVLVNGKRERSCLLTAGEVADRSVTTIEGLAQGDELNLVQKAFLDANAGQCGYCIPGMILSTVALLQEKAAPTDSEIVSWMNGHLCRCCGYPGILQAVRNSVEASRKAQP